MGFEPFREKAQRPAKHIPVYDSQNVDDLVF
jgi:hypothetical protein